MRMQLIIFIVMLFGASSYAFNLHAAESPDGAVSESHEELSSVAEDAFFKTMDEHIATVSGFKANFVQERRVEIFNGLLCATGSLYYEKPDRLRWEMHQPYASFMILNGGRVAKFNRDNDKYLRMKTGMEKLMQEALKQVMTMMSADFDKMKDDYDITVLKDKNYLVTLTPASDAMRDIISSIILNVDSTAYHVIKVEIFESHGDSIEIKFFDTQENIPFTKDLFDLSDPALPESILISGRKACK